MVGVKFVFVDTAVISALHHNMSVSVMIMRVRIISIIHKRIITFQMNSLGVLLLASVAVSLAAGQGTNPGMQRRYRPELQRFRRQPQQTNEGGLLSLPQRLLKKVGLRGQAPRPSLERRLGPAPQNRRLRPAVPQQRPQVRPQQEKAPVLPEAESRRFQEFRPEPEVFEDNFENYYEEPEPVYQREPEPVYQPRPQRQSSGANRAPIRTADKRLDVDSDLSESVPIPSQQRDIEAAVHAGAAGFQPVRKPSLAEM